MRFRFRRRPNWREEVIRHRLESSMLYDHALRVYQAVLEDDAAEIKARALVLVEMVGYREPANMPQEELEEYVRVWAETFGAELRRRNLVYDRRTRRLIPRP